MRFTELPLTNSLLEGLDAMNFKETTPVQELAIPILLKGKDVIACAQTGTGKTAAFLLPLLNNLQTDNHEYNKVNAIIMAPTRELAQQIDQMMEGFSYYTPFSSVAVYGGNDGEAWDVQKKGLQNGADVVIATPGRLLSHINLYNIDFSGVKYFILDEADRMLDMGFYDDIMKIVKLLPKERQTVMFSATMPPKIQQMAKTILADPEEITIAVAKPPESIIQSAYICYESQKMEILQQLFKDKKPHKVILFSGKKQKVKEIAKTLHRMNLSVGEMHSDLDQAQREHIMHEFKNERVDILVATDIVARGIDIDDITLVINFDVPYDVEDYVHRIGRTARAGDSGMAMTFVSPEEQYLFEQIEQFLQKKIYRIPVPVELGEVPEYIPEKFKRQRGSKRSSSRIKTERAKRTTKDRRSAKTEKSSVEKKGNQMNKTSSQKNDMTPKKERNKKKDRTTKNGVTSNNEEVQRNETALNKEESLKKDGTNKTGRRTNARSNRNYKNKKQRSTSQSETLAQESGRLKGKVEYDKKPINSKNKKLIKKKRDFIEPNTTGIESASDERTSNEKINPLNETISEKRKPVSGKRAPVTKKTVTMKSETNLGRTETIKKTEGTDNKKKWSWWPFGKK